MSNQLFFGSMKQISNSFKIIYVRVDENGEIECDFAKYFGTQSDLAEILEISINFKNKRFQISKDTKIKFIPRYPGKNLPTCEEMEEQEGALLTFDFQDSTPCPKVLIIFKYQSYIKEQTKLSQKLSQYKIENKLLGRGSFGDVSKVQEKSTQNWYAMKKIDLNSVQKNLSINYEDLRIKIVKEALMQSQIDCINVIKIKEFFESEDNFYIVMELGQLSFDQFLINRKQLNDHLFLTELKEYMIHICLAVKAAHDLGIMHRDLKPENFVLCEGNILKLIDFGLARKSYDASTQLGTLLYMSPEILLGNRYTNAADIFSLGCIFYYMITFRKAFIEGGTDFFILNNIVKEQPKPLCDYQVELPYPLETMQLCYQMLEKDPFLRPNIDNVLFTLQSIQISVEQQIKSIISKINVLNNKALLIKTYLNQQISFNLMNDHSRIIEDLMEICEAIIYNLAFQHCDEKRISDEINAFCFGEIRCEKLESCTIIESQSIFKKIAYSTGEILVGKFISKKLTGFCKQITPDQTTFNCEFVNGLKSGIGTMNSHLGDKYTGEWSADKQNGKGRLEFKNGDVYEGEFKDELREGFGILKCANGDCYEGNWKEDKKCGRGKQTWDSSDLKGDIYEGQFENDAFYGYGHYKYANGDWYEGKFLSGVQCGQTIQKYLDGDSIEIRSNKVKSNYDAITSSLKVFIEEITQQIEQNNAIPLKVINLKDFLEIVEIILFNIQQYQNLSSIKNDIIQLMKNFVTKVIDSKTFTGRIGSNATFEYCKCTLQSEEVRIGPFNSDMKLNGWGKIIYNINNKQHHQRLSYEGEFENGNFNGFGIRKFKSGEVYNSFRWFNLPNGLGKAQIQVGPNQFDTYEGGVWDNEYNGYGKYTWANGSWYEGEWKNGMKSGKGKEVMANGNSYEGGYIDDEFCGFGKYTNANGGWYEGEWKNGQRYGKGKQVFTDGDSYEGDYVDDKYCGYGKYTWANGDWYEGEYKNGMKNGKGKQILANGNSYEGNFVDDKYCGYGKYTWNNGEIDEGVFKGIFLNREGKRTYTDGSIYTGQFDYDYRHGQGKLVKTTGEIVEGVWEYDELIEQTENTVECAKEDEKVK